jgi:hypothetical protein
MMIGYVGLILLLVTTVKGQCTEGAVGVDNDVYPQLTH